jgi:hypothetical protein
VGVADGHKALYYSVREVTTISYGSEKTKFELCAGNDILPFRPDRGWFTV